MKLGDYVRLGSASIRAHRKRIAKVVIIVGVLFGVILAGSMLVRGIEQMAIGEMLRPTVGKVLTKVVMRPEFFEWGSEAEMMERMRRQIEEKGGEILDLERYRVGNGEMVALPEEIIAEGLEVDPAEAPEGVVPVYAPMSMILRWLKISVPQYATAEQRVGRLEEAQERALGKVVEIDEETKVFVAGVMPGAAVSSDLSLDGAGQEFNPLNLVLGLISIGSSEGVLVETGDGRIDKILDKVELLDTEGQEGDLGVWQQRPEVIWAVFGDLEELEKFQGAAGEYCSGAKSEGDYCRAVYEYAIETPIGNPLELAKVFGVVRLVGNIVAGVLAAIAAIIMLTTYLRLIDQDRKVIALYHASGATSGQVALVYGVYLLMLSLLAFGFALGLAVILTWLVNLLNATALAQAWALAMGMVGERVYLMGWSGWILVTMGVMGAMAVAGEIRVKISSYTLR